MPAPPGDHTGNAARAGMRLCRRMLLMLAVTLLGAVLVNLVGLWGVMIAGASAWLAFTAFTIWFFRDPMPHVPTDPDAIVAPAHGRVDFVGPWTERELMGGDCHRISIFLSVFDVHVQNAPLAGVVQCLRYHPGRFRAAFSRKSEQGNENLFIGLQSSDNVGELIGMRLIAGFLARRVVCWVREGESVERGQRLGLIQFGSRCDLYLPTHSRIVVKLGDRVLGGETIMARSPGRLIAEQLIKEQIKERK